MAEDFRYTHGRNRDAERFDAERFEALRVEAEYRYVASYGDEEDAFVWRDESVDDGRFLTGAMDEPVNEAVDDPTVNESPAYQRIRRMKGSRRGQARARRQKDWIPPDLRRFGSPVFWPVEEPHEQGPARRMAINPSEWSDIMRDVQRQVFMVPLMNCSELARAMELDEDLVTEAAEALR